MHLIVGPPDFYGQIYSISAQRKDILCTMKIPRYKILIQNVKWYFTTSKRKTVMERL